MLNLLHKKCKLRGVHTWSNSKKCKRNLWRLPYLPQRSIIVVRCSNSSIIYFFFWSIFSILLSLQLLLLLQDGSLLAATINGFPLSTAKITEKRKIIEEIALADVKKVRHYFSHHRSSFVTILLYTIIIYIRSNLVIVNFFDSQ